MKGLFNGNCNRTACQKPEARWYNHSTKAYYCAECAELINLHNRKEAMEIYGHDLCVEEFNNNREVFDSTPVYTLKAQRIVEEVNLYSAPSKINCKKGHIYIDNKCRCGQILTE